MMRWMLMRWMRALLFSIVTTISVTVPGGDYLWSGLYAAAVVTWP